MHRLKNSRQILNLGRRSAARWPEQHNPGGPHLSGKAHYLKMVASQNKRFGTYQAPVPAVREYAVAGARVDVLTKWKGGAGPDGRGDSIGAFSERRFDLEACGGPVLKLIWQNAVIDAAGIATVRKHVDRYGEDPENEAMIARLERILAGKSPATDWDKRYYTHELREYERYRALGVSDGTDPGREVWNNAHTATLEDFGLADYATDGLHNFYHPEI